MYHYSADGMRYYLRQDNYFLLYSKEKTAPGWRAYVYVGFVQDQESARKWVDGDNTVIIQNSESEDK